ncbi:MAG: hypothetical protein P1U74_08770 [Legionellaceae bacterium]|nr:hypothetical protein [Legionellaceae bacterium]
MNKNNLKNFILPILFDEATSCLTTENIEEMGIEWLSMDLSSLLMKPGIDILKTLNSIKSYVSWNRNIVLNASSLKVNSKGKFWIQSQFDGSRHYYTNNEILDLILNLAVEMVVLPEKISLASHEIKSTNTVLLFSMTEYLANNNVIKSINSPGLYLDYNKANNDQAKTFLKDFPGTSKYIFGDINLKLMQDLLKYDDLYVESTKPSTDGYNGFIYSHGKVVSILDDGARLNFNTLDSSCSCQVCAEGLSASYLHHLYQHTPLLCQRLLISHNVFYAGHLRQA